MNRDDWRLVLPVHLAETRKEAIEEARLGSQAGTCASTPRAPTDANPCSTVRWKKSSTTWSTPGSWIIGTPDDCVEAIKRLDEQSGGFGGFLVQTIDWAPREKMLRSYELLARYVMPQFQGSLVGTQASNQWAARKARHPGSRAGLGPWTAPARSTQTNAPGNHRARFDTRRFKPAPFHRGAGSLSS